MDYIYLLWYIIALALIAGGIVYFLRSHKAEVQEWKENMHDMDQNMESFFGKTFYKLMNRIIQIVAILGLLGSVAAYYLGITSTIGLESTGLMIFMLLIIAIVVTFIIRGFMWLFYNWEKVLELFKSVLAVIFIIIGILATVAFCLYDCSGCSNRSNDIDHVHYEKY